MIKHNTLSIKKTFSLAVLMAASALVGCGGDATSGSGSNSTLNSSLASAQACALPEELCGTWQDTSPNADDNDTFVDGRITSKSQKTDDDGTVTKTTVSMQLKHAETKELKDGRTAYFVYVQSFALNSLFENDDIATLTQEEKNNLSAVIKSNFESEKHVECSEPSFTTKTVSVRCYVGFTKQNSPSKLLLTVEQGRLCGTGADSDNLFGNSNGQPVDFPAEPDANHSNDCMRRP